jgi:hypothetical protein
VKASVEEVAGGVHMIKLHSHTDEFASYDLTDATTPVASLFDLQEAVHFTVVFEFKPKVVHLNEDVLPISVFTSVSL